MKALYELTNDEIVKLSEINPVAIFGGYDEQPKKFASTAVGCTVNLQRVSVEEDHVKFTGNVLVIGESNRVVELYVQGIMKPNTVMYFSPLPPEAVSIILNVIRENTVVSIKPLETLTEPHGGVHPMLAFFKNLSAYVDALHGATGLLEDNINQLRQMVEQTNDENLKMIVETLEIEAIEAIRRMNGLLPKITETYSMIYRKVGM
ncbi:hypothetical protein [Pseudothermotoga sp.]|uniref:hypothetical protein n=1 Tax=Pseudothermotoga sp. TaxID=2033661 RepID=UPI0031F6EED2